MGNELSAASADQSSRRSFILGGLATAAAVSVAGCDGGAGSMLAPAATSVAAGPPLTQSEMGIWETLVGTTFLIAGESGSTVATLAALEQSVDATRPSDLARHQPFYAYFETDPRTAPEGDKSYRLSQPSKAPFDLFLGQASEVRGKTVFVAVFN